MAKVNFSLRKTNTQNIYPCLHLQKAFITHFAYVLNVNIYNLFYLKDIEYQAPALEKCLI